jgi:hypothetical protein
MTISIIIGIAVIAIVLGYIIYVTKKSKRHLDDLSITGTGKETEK